MGGGTGTEHASRHEEPAVETEASLTGELEVDLDPDDVWTLGQLIEAGAVSLPPRVAEELMTGYRILQASGYQPSEDAQTDVQLRGSGEASGIELPVEDDGDGGITSRRVILTEVATEEPDVDEDADAIEAGVDVEPRRREPAVARDGHEAEVTAHVAAPAGEQTERLAEAIDELAGAVEDLEPAGQQAPKPVSAADTLDMHGALVLDWALIGLGLGVSTMLVLAAAVIADPVFAILGIALLVLCVFQAVPYLVEDDSRQEGSG